MQSKQVEQILLTLLDILYIPEAVRQLLVRKAAHYIEFSVLSLLWSGVFREKQLYISFVFSALTAAIDELIQRCVPGRSGQITDVLIDCTGAATTLVLLWAGLEVVGKYRKRNHRKHDKSN